MKSWPGLAVIAASLVCGATWWFQWPSLDSGRFDHDGPSRITLEPGEAAADVYARALRTQPLQPGVWTQFAIALREHGDFKKSAKARQAARRLDPSNPSMRAALALEELALGNDVAALADIQRALALGYPGESLIGTWFSLGHSGEPLIKLLVNTGSSAKWLTRSLGLIARRAPSAQLHEIVRQLTANNVLKSAAFDMFKRLESLTPEHARTLRIALIEGIVSDGVLEAIDATSPLVPITSIELFNLGPGTWQLSHLAWPSFEKGGVVINVPANLAHATPILRHVMWLEPGSTWELTWSLDELLGAQPTSWHWELRLGDATEEVPISGTLGVHSQRLLIPLDAEGRQELSLVFDPSTSEANAGCSVRLSRVSVRPSTR